MGRQLRFPFLKILRYNMRENNNQLKFWLSEDKSNEGCILLKIDSTKEFSFVLHV